MTKLNVNEIFHSIQGEGVYVGLNTVFLRLSECNLHCAFCDTQYHWEGNRIEIDKVVEQIVKFNSHSVVITGGEPLLQQDALTILCQKLRDLEKYIIVETNATIVAKEELCNLVNHWSCSPKLVSSGNDLSKRINYDALLAFKDEGCIFKFVVANDKDFKEVKFLQDQLKIEPKQIYLMKEGGTAKEQFIGIHEFIQRCIDGGYNFSPRLHVMVWDNKRGV